ncbi:hypothetical protein HK100_010821 [Physocladia obscura]|uniref:TIR domain-containing protein n=1 Tax=Physocladia obscura TaxID=109957 RepID=A0AAD5XDN2_9FUNG|nr:hypothetical protein HK100_010821 [Physocladia obscura]
MKKSGAMRFWPSAKQPRETVQISELSDTTFHPKWNQHWRCKEHKSHHDFFISYRHNSDAFNCDRLALILEQISIRNNHACHVFFDDRCLPIGVDLTSSLYNALLRTKHIILIVSHEALSSMINADVYEDNVLLEWEIALDLSEENPTKHTVLAVTLPQNMGPGVWKKFHDFHISDSMPDKFSYHHASPKKRTIRQTVNAVLELCKHHIISMPDYTSLRALADSILATAGMRTLTAEKIAHEITEQRPLTISRSIYFAFPSPHTRANVKIAPLNKTWECVHNKSEHDFFLSYRPFPDGPMSERLALIIERVGFHKGQPSHVFFDQHCISNWPDVGNPTAKWFQAIQTSRCIILTISHDSLNNMMNADKFEDEILLQWEVAIELNKMDSNRYPIFIAALPHSVGVNAWKEFKDFGITYKMPETYSKHFASPRRQTIRETVKSVLGLFSKVLTPDYGAMKDFASIVLEQPSNASSIPSSTFADIADFTKFIFYNRNSNVSESDLTLVNNYNIWDAITQGNIDALQYFLSVDPEIVNMMNPMETHLYIGLLEHVLLLFPFWQYCWIG